MIETLNPGDVVMWTPRPGKRPYICSVARISPKQPNVYRELYPDLNDEEFDLVKGSEWYEAGNPNLGPEEMDFSGDDILRSGRYGLIFSWSLIKDACDGKVLWRNTQNAEEEKD